MKKHEVDSLFSHFDTKGLGQISLEDFKRGLNQRAQLESKMHFYLSDFMTSLQTLMKRSRLHPGDMFDLFVSKVGATHATSRTFSAILNHYL